MNPRMVVFAIFACVMIALVVIALAWLNQRQRNKWPKTRRQLYGFKAGAFFDDAMSWYYYNGDMCREGCPGCGKCDCRTAWMKTLIDENGDIVPEGARGTEG